MHVDIANIHVFKVQMYAMTTRNQQDTRSKAKTWFGT